MNGKDKKELKMNKLRTELSIKRTLLACKRSLLSYISTACVFVSLAFTYLKLASVQGVDVFLILMFGIGFLFLTFGIIEYFIIKKQTNEMLRNFELEVDEEEMSNDE